MDFTLACQNRDNLFSSESICDSLSEDVKISPCSDISSVKELHGYNWPLLLLTFTALWKTRWTMPACCLEPFSRLPRWLQIPEACKNMSKILSNWSQMLKISLKVLFLAPEMNICLITISFPWCSVQCVKCEIT